MLVGLDQLVKDLDPDSAAQYHRGLAGEQHERLGAGKILGSSVLTARGVLMAGEYEPRTSVARLGSQDFRAGGSFCEVQALNLDVGAVEIGHNGPAHKGLGASQPLLRRLGFYRGKRGWVASVEFDVKHGPVTTIGVGQDPNGNFIFIASEREVIPRPLLVLGNTTSRVDVGDDPGVWVDE